MFVTMPDFGSRHNRFYFRDGNHREESEEQEEKREEQAKGPYIGKDIDPGRRIVVPRRWQIVVRKRRNGNNEALKPHPDIYKNRYYEHDWNASSKFLKPEHLRR